MTNYDSKQAEADLFNSELPVGTPVTFGPRNILDTVQVEAWVAQNDKVLVMLTGVGVVSADQVEAWVS